MLKADLQRLRRSTAVDHKHLASYEGRGARRQIEGQRADFVGLADSTNRLRGFHVLAASFVLPEIFTEIGLDQSGRDGVHSHAVPAKLAGPTASEHDQARFGKA